MIKQNKQTQCILFSFKAKFKGDNLSEQTHFMTFAYIIFEKNDNFFSLCVSSKKTPLYLLHEMSNFYDEKNGARMK